MDKIRYCRGAELAPSDRLGYYSHASPLLLEMPTRITKLAVVTSLEGSPIPVDCSEGFEVKNATVVAGNIEADNGVIHVIDRVILMG